MWSAYPSVGLIGFFERGVKGAQVDLACLVFFISHLPDFVHPSLCLAAGILLCPLPIYPFQNKRLFFDGMVNEILLRQGSRGLQNGKGAPLERHPIVKSEFRLIPPNRLQLLGRITLRQIVA